jgi:oligoendopeptidase F
MSLLPFNSLRPYRPRRFVPAAADAGDWASLEPLFDRLQDRLSLCASVAELEVWLLDWSELTAAIEEEAARRYIAMTCHTDNADAERAYLDFIEHLEPRLKPRQFALEQALIAHPQRAHLPAQRYAVLLRDARNHVELFREENVPLETDESKLGQQYQKLSGALTVNFDGREQTLIQMGRYQEETDRPLRQRAWEAVAARRLAEQEQFEAQFDALLALRESIAANAGFANYRDYAFRRLGRFDYTPADCVAFHDAVAAEVVPALRTLQAARRQHLGLATLRPWDVAVDPLGRPPLRPFTEPAQLVAGCQRIFDQLDPELAAGFRLLQDQRLLDLDNHKGKAPGGYQSTLPESRVPFIFMNAVGLQRDVEILLHEAGHAFHALAAREEDLLPYRNSPPIEFCEVASMSMELLGAEFLGEFHPPAEADRARRTHLEGIIGVLTWIATVDAFQHWLYTHPGHSRAERAAAWMELMDRFAGDVDWSGWEDARRYLWHRQLHLFLYPFYYIEYGIAQLGALQVWANAKLDKPQALADYKHALALGGSQSLPALFAAAGCPFQFDRARVAPLMELVRGELAPARMEERG